MTLIKRILKYREKIPKITMIFVTNFFDSHQLFEGATTRFDFNGIHVRFNVTKN